MLPSTKTSKTKTIVARRESQSFADGPDLVHLNSLLGRDSDPDWRFDGVRGRISKSLLSGATED